MIEASKTIYLSNIYIDRMVRNISSILHDCRLMEIERYYMFSRDVNGCSLAQARNNSIELDIQVSKLIAALSADPLLSGMTIVEQGIAFNNQNPGRIINDRVEAYHLLDTTARQVRVQISGTSMIGRDMLITGNAYIVDNVTHNQFFASDQCMQLVFNYLSITETRKPWELWKSSTGEIHGS